MNGRDRRHRKAAARQRRRAHEADYGVMVGWCKTEAELDEARRLLHDGVIDMMGARRRGAVTWRWETGDDADQLLAKLVQGTATGDQAILSHYRRVRAHLREYGGIVVVAMAPGVPPARP